MRKYQIELSEEEVDGIKEMILRENFPVDPNDPIAFLNWLVDNNLESRAKEKQRARVNGMSAKDLKEALDKWEKKPEKP